MSSPIKQPLRKIIHIDMDAFYASVEQRDNPELRGKAIGVGHNNGRGVVTTASYEARKFGIHSAMAMSTAKRLCPDLIVVPPRFEAYRAVSAQIREIFYSYTDLVEPVSLDEAYLDVTHNKKNIPSAWTVARNIRDDILRVTGLTASAGVSFNKFLAKMGSDMNKPDGQFLITPEKSEQFVATLPIPKFHGIGPKTAQKMHDIGINSGMDLRSWTSEALQARFGKVGNWYYQIARGEDDRPVEPNRERKSVSSERTFHTDIFTKQEISDALIPIVDDVWKWVEKEKTYGRTVTLKIKWDDFTQSTKSKTSTGYVITKEKLLQTSLQLFEPLFPLTKSIRLIGIGLSNFNEIETKESAQLPLAIE